MSGTNLAGLENPNLHKLDYQHYAGFAWSTISGRFWTNKHHLNHSRAIQSWTLSSLKLLATKKSQCEHHLLVPKPSFGIKYQTLIDLCWTSHYHLLHNLKQSIASDSTAVVQHTKLTFVDRTKWHLLIIGALPPTGAILWPRSASEPKYKIAQNWNTKPWRQWTRCQMHFDTSCFFSAAAAVCIISHGMLMAGEDPKPGLSGAKKLYASVCVTIANGQDLA